MCRGGMAPWVSGVPLFGATDACAYQPRRVQSVGEQVGCRPSKRHIPALSTPVGAHWCRVAWQGRDIPCPS